MSKRMPHEWWEEVNKQFMPPVSDDRRRILQPVPVLRNFPSVSISDLQANHFEIFDHGGISWQPMEINDVTVWCEVLVGEPYYLKYAQSVALAERNGLHFLLSANTYWLPGHSYRHEFWPIRPDHISIMVSAEYDELENVDCWIPEDRIRRLELGEYNAHLRLRV